MKVKKGEKTYTVTETKNTWSVKTGNTKVNVTYSVAKELCETAEDVKKYILENEMF